MSRRCAVYRAFDEHGKLLYVGIALNWGKRWTQHAERSPFFALVARLEIAWFPTEQHAHAEELRLIAEHNPPWNVRGRSDRDSVTKGGSVGLVCDRCFTWWTPEAYEGCREGTHCIDMICSRRGAPECSDPQCFGRHRCGGRLVRGVNLGALLPKKGERHRKMRDGSIWADDLAFAEAASLAREAFSNG